MTSSAKTSLRPWPCSTSRWSTVVSTPLLIGSELAHLLEAWEEAVAGSDGPLEALASAQARRTLLRPRHDTRLTVRDAVLKSWAPTSLELTRKPPAIEVMLDVEAVRLW